MAVTLTTGQLDRVKSLLKIPKHISNREMLENLDYKIDEINSSLLVIIHYKSYLDIIDPYWKQFRGVIIKNFEKIIADSNGHTPILTLTQKMPKSGKMKLKEYSKDGSYIEHTLDFTPGACHLRPGFQGTIVRISLVNGEIIRSTLRRINMKDSKWPNADETITFEQKFNLLCQYGKELFTPGKLNSPFCHVFLMCVPQSLTYSHIDCGEGFVMYLQTIKCYESNEDDENEEQESYLSQKAENLTEEEKEADVKTIKDRYFFPLSSNETSLFIPPPSTIELLKQYAAVYVSDVTMTTDEANLFVTKGVSKIPNSELIEISRVSPLLLPGEGIFYTGYNKKGERTSNYIILPECCNYRSAVNNDPNNRVRQLIQLRQINNSNATIDVFHNNITTENLSLENIIFPSKDNNYFIFNLLKKLSPIDFNFINPASNVKSIDAEDNIDIDLKFNILSYFYVLSNPILRRQIAYDSISKAQKRIEETFDFIIKNQVELSDTQSDIYKKKVLNNPKHFETSQKIRDIISASSIKNGILAAPKETIKTKIPKKKELGPTPSSIPKKDENSYAQVLIKQSKEKNQDKINSNIVRFLNEETGIMLYKITSAITSLVNSDE